MHEETVDRKVSQFAAEATATDVIDNLEDALCSGKEYNKKQKVDGTFDEEVVYTFVSDFHKEVIEYTI